MSRMLSLSLLAGCVSLNRPAEYAPQDTIYMASLVYEFTSTSCTKCVQEKMMQNLLPHVHVGLLVNNHGEFVGYQHDLTALGVSSTDLAKLVEVPVAHDDIWMRDYLINVDYRIAGTSSQIASAGTQNGYSAAQSSSLPTSGKAILDGDFDGWGFERFISLGYFDTDDDIAPNLAAALNVPTIESSMIFEGGAVNSDGAGTLAYSYKALHERQPSWTQQQIEDELKRITGARKLLTPPYMHLYDGQPIVDPPVILDGHTYQVFGVNHIDEIQSFGPNHTMLVATLDQSYVRNSSEQTLHDQLEANYQFWLSATDANGQHYNVVRMPDPGMQTIHLTKKDATWAYLANFADDGLIGFDPEGGDVIMAGTYMNYVVSNGIVLVQKFDHFGTDPTLAARDAAAVAALRTVYPSPAYTIAQIDAYDVNVNGGGIHCIVQDWETPML